MHLEYLDGDTKLILTDYDNRRCIEIHSKKDQITYENVQDETSISSIPVQTKSQLLQKPSVPISNSITSSNTDVNQTLFKVRTKGYLTKFFYLY